MTRPPKNPFTSGNRTRDLPLPCRTLLVSILTQIFRCSLCIARSIGAGARSVFELFSTLSPSHSRLAQDQPAVLLEPSLQASGMVATRVAVVKTVVEYDWGDNSDVAFILCSPGHLTSRLPGRSLFVGCLTSKQQASVSQGRICSDKFTCCHTEIEAADQSFYLTQSQYTDTGPTTSSADPTTPGARQGSHWSANF